MATPRTGRALQLVCESLTCHGAEDTDEALLARFVAARDEAAFAALVRRHGPTVNGVCRRLLREVHDAEDAFQATFLVLARKASSIRKGESLSSWLHGVAVRVARKARLAAARRERRERGRTAPTPTDPADAVTWGELRSALDEELARLPAAWSAPLILCYLDGYTQDEAARRLGWSKSTLRRRLERGRARLRQRLERRGLTLPAVLAGPLLTGSAASAALTSRVMLAVTPSGGVTSAAERVAGLADAAVKGMSAWGGKLAALLLMMAALAAASGLLASGEPKNPPAPQEAPPVAGKLVPGEPVDSFGDALPAGALTRLGTYRLRHGHLITGIEFAPDGRTVASASLDGTVRVWDRTSGKELLRIDNEYPGHRALGLIGGIGYSPDGKYLAGARLNQPPCLWDAATGKLVHEFGEERMRSEWVLFSPDGKTLAYGGYRLDPGTVRFCDVASGKELRRFRGEWLIFSPDGVTVACGARGDPVVRLTEAATGKVLHLVGKHQGEVIRAAFSPDGKTLATADDDRIRFFDVGTGQLREVAAAGGQVPRVGSLTFSPDGKLVAAIGSNKKAIRVIDTATGKAAWTADLPGKREDAVTLLFTPDGKTLISGHDFGDLRFWAAETGEKRTQFRAHYGSPLHLTVSPDGKTLASTTNRAQNYAVRLWDVATGKPHLHQPGPQGGIGRLVYSPDGRRAATASWDGSIHAWNAETGKLLREWKLFGPVAFTPDGATLVCGGWSDGVVRYLDVATGKETLQFRADAQGVRHLELSRDGKLLFTAGNEGLRVWDGATGKAVRAATAEEKSLYWEFALAQDGRRIAARGEDNTVRLWDTGTGKVVREIPHTGEVSTVALSPDGRLLASTCQGDPQWYIRLTEVATGREVRRLPGNGYPLDSLAFSPDGRSLLWGGQGKTELYLWEVETGQLRRTFTGHAGELTRVAFAPDGRTMASGSADGFALVWDATGRLDRERPQPKLDEARLAALWAELASKEGAVAYKAICTLRASPSAAVELLERRLRPVPWPDGERIKKALRDLEGQQFAVRERAAKELQDLAEAAELPLRQALEGKPSEELRRRIERILERLDGPEVWRRGRALEVLEHIGDAASRRLLAALAEGAPQARLTVEAQAALARLRR